MRGDREKSKGKINIPKRRIEHLINIVKDSKELKKQMKNSGWIPTHPYSYRWWGGLKDPREIVISAILVQLNRWEQVKKALNIMRERNLISYRELSSINTDELARNLHGINFRYRKAKIIKEVAEKVLKPKAWSKLKKSKTSQVISYLLSIDGIGRETAESIALFAFNKPIVPYTRLGARVLARLLGIDSNYRSSRVDEGIYNTINSMISGNLYLAKMIHAATITIAKKYCHEKAPKCSTCIVKNICRFSSKE